MQPFWRRISGSGVTVSGSNVGALTGTGTASYSGNLVLNDASGIGNVVHFEPSNVLLLTGKASVVNRLVDLVQRVDQSGVQRREIVPLRFASAKELSDMLNNLNNEEQKGQNAPQLATKVVADDETNSLVISGSPEARQRTRTLISQLDREQNNEGNTRVFYLKYANASKVVPVLTDRKSVV